MRPFGLAVLLLCCCGLAFAQTDQPVTFTARSDHYAMQIDATGLSADEHQFEVHVTDLTTKATVATKLASTGFKVAETTIAGPGTDFKISIQSTDSAIVTDLSVQQNGQTAETLHATHNVLSGRTLVAINTPRVGGGVKAPMPKQRVEPVYPDEARRAHITGIVILEVLIDKTGVVSDAIALKDLGSLGQSALDAVRQWQFEPATRDGQPVDALFNLTMNFRLN